MKYAILTLLVAFLGISGVVAGVGNPNEPETAFTWHQNGLSVSFEDTTPLPLYNIAWYWDFGDGTHTDVQNPIHEYPGYGNYTVYFTVWNSDGYSRTDSQKVWVQEGVNATPQYTMIFWISLVLVFGGMFVILFGKFGNVRIGGALVTIVGVMLLVVNPPQVGLSEAVHTDNSFVAYAVPVMLLVLLIAGIAVAKNPYVRIGLVLAFVTSIVVLMVV